MADGTTSPSKSTAKIAVIGCGWWSQGWHLPCIDRNKNASLVAIVDTSSYPKSCLNNNLESLSSLEKRYNTKAFSSVNDLMNDALSSDLDGVLIATPHATHYSIAKSVLSDSSSRREKPLNILMEKPMSTDIQHAIDLYELVQQTTEKKTSGNDKNIHGKFWINHSANFRIQTKLARETIVSGKIGRIRHITAFFASPLMWIFDDPGNKGWNEPIEGMLGNGFAWGQSSHLFAWLYHVCPMLRPIEVFCNMTHSDVTGADVSHSATIRCGTNSTSADSSSDDDGENIVLSVSGTSLLPGNAHSDPPVAKEVQIQIFGSEGSLLYIGNDRDPTSGNLELRKPDGSIDILHEQFDFENLDNEGLGPESLQNFVQLCRGHGTNEDDVHAGANVMDGLRSVQTIDAMYRSNASLKPERVLHPKV